MPTGMVPRLRWSKPSTLSNATTADVSGGSGGGNESSRAVQFLPVGMFAGWIQHYTT